MPCPGDKANKHRFHRKISLKVVVPERRAAAEVEVALAGREEFMAMVTTGGGAAEEEAAAGDVDAELSMKKKLLKPRIF